jgi:transcriptional antiterminator RfaH
MIANTSPQVSPLPAVWHVLQLKPNGLKIAEVNLARQGYATLMPMREMSQHSSHRLHSTKRPLFPGYLFFGLDVGQINWRAVANTRGVARVVTGIAGEPARLPDGIAQSLALATNDDGMLKNMTDYQAGDSVGVINGPFSGWLAKVIASDEAGRLQLLVDVMGREAQVIIAGEHVEKRDT